MRQSGWHIQEELSAGILVNIRGTQPSGKDCMLLVTAWLPWVHKSAIS
jgi:hypothetical protein